MSRYRTDYAGIASPARAGKSSNLRGEALATPRSGGFTFSDPRLEGIPGLSVGPSVGGMALGGGRAGVGTQGSGYDLAAQRYAVTHEDPYAEVARREAEIGRRMPLPYQTSSALAGQLPSPERMESQYTEVRDRSAAYEAASISGQHVTQWGTTGTPLVRPATWDMRQQFGGYQMNSRNAFSEEWDARGGRERRSGRLQANSTKMSQRVDSRFPYLRLRAKGVTSDAGNAYDGNAQVRVTAGISETGGAESVRTFWLGGGFVAEFDLQGWDQCTVEILQILTGTYVEFSWTVNGLQSGNKDLYLPQRITPAAGGTAVPEGAYGIIVEDPTPAVPATTLTMTWTTADAAGGGADLVFSQVVGDDGTSSGLYFGQVLRVLGTNLQWTLPMGVLTVDVVWVLRTI